MKGYLMPFLILALVIIPGYHVSGDAGAQKRFTIRLEQKGKPVEISNHEAHLEKTDFTVIIVFQRPAIPEVLVNASYSDDSFKSAIRGAPLTEIAGFQETGMADYSLNPLRELMISNTAPNFWYYDSPVDHRYDRIRDYEGKWECERDVSRFMDRDGSGTSIDIEKSECKELHLVFIQTEWNADCTRQRENHRECVRIFFDK